MKEMREPIITDETIFHCPECGHSETLKEAILEYDGYFDSSIPYCSKCGHRSYLLKKEDW